MVSCVDSDRYQGLRTRTGFELRLASAPGMPGKAELERIGDALMRERDAIRQTRLAIERLLLPAEAAMYEASARLCAENDLVVGHYFLYTLGAAPEKHRRPYVSVVLVHGAVPSAFQPPSCLPDLGAFGNRLAWRLGRWALNRGLKRFPDRLRASLGMAPAHDLIDTVWASGDLNVLAVSPAICATQPDWPDHYKVCGALDTPASVAEDGLSPQLEAFLAAGSPPVYLTFGSMTSGSDERQTIALLAEAARAAAVRAIVQVPSWAQLGVECSDHVRFVASAPHAAVFPRCSAVVHHGGAVTSHTALRAGVPSVVVPHTAEQELWARELRRLGVAGPPIIRRRATPRRIADAIAALGKSGRIGANARALGARMAREDGVATAVRLIEARFAV